MAKILIVDDSKDLTEFLSVLLKMKDYDVDIAASKGELKRKLPVVSPDLILLDVRLGGDDGRELCKAIRKEMPDKHIPIILVSASPELLKDYEECEANDVIEKPFDISTIITKIDSLLSKNSQLN